MVFRAAAGLLIALAFVGRVGAATIVWDGDTSTAYSTGANWVGDVPPANNITGDVGQFSAATAFRPTLTGSRSVLGLDFATAGWTVGVGAGAVLTVGAVGIDSAGAGVNTFSHGVALGANSTWTVAAGNTLVAGGNITGAFTLTKDGDGTLEVSAASSTFGTLAVDAGRVYVNGTGRLGDTTQVSVGTGALLEYNTGTTDRFNTLNGAGTVRLVGASTGIIVNSGTFSGVIEGEGSLYKYNTGALVLTGTNTYTGFTASSTNSGTAVVLSGAAGSAAFSSEFRLGALYDTTYRMELRLDNSGAGNNNNQRVGDTAAVYVRGGSLNVLGNVDVATVEDVGAVTLDYRHGDITLQPAAGGATTVVADSLARGATNATLLVRGANLGQAPAAGAANLKFDAPPTLSHAGGAGTTAVGIVPYIVADTSATGLGSELATYDVNGVRPLAAAEYAAAVTAGANVKLAASTATGSQTIRGLVLTNAGAGTALSIAAGQTLTVEGGAIVSAGSGDNSISGGALTFGNNAATGYEGVIYTVSDLTLGSSVVDNGAAAVSLTKSGAGVLNLTAANSYSGTTTFNGGSVILAVDGALGPGALRNFASLSFNGTRQAVGNLDGAGSISLGTGGGLSANVTTDSTYFGVISGAGELAKLGPETLNFRNGMTYSGRTYIRQGELALIYTNGAAVNSSGFTVAPGAILQLNNGSSSSSSYNINSRIGDAAEVSLQGGTFYVRGNSSVATTEDFGNLALQGGNGTVTLDALGGGALTLVGDTLTRAVGATATVRADALGAVPAANVANLTFSTPPPLTHSGSGTQVGVLPYLLGDTSITGAGAGLVTYGGNGVRLLDTATEYSSSFAADQNVRVSAAVSNLGSMTIRALATSSTGASSFTITQQAGSTLVVESNAIFSSGTQSAYLRGGAITFGANAANAYEGIIHATSSFVLENTLADNGGNSVSLVKNGSGSLYLRGLSGAANTYTGRTFINAGYLQLRQQGHLGASPAAFVADHVVLAGGSIRSDATGTLVFDDPNRGFTLASNSGGFYADTGKTIDFGSPLSGAGTLNKAGAGLLILRGDQLYSGRTVVGSGTLQIAAEANLGVNPSAFAADHLAVGAATLHAIADVTIDDANRGVSVTASAATLAADVGRTLHIVNAVSGAGGVNVAGGTVKLSGQNVYAGPTNVNAGTLLVGGVHANGSAIGAYNVAADATLGGNGQIGGAGSLANVTVAAGGVVSPGESIGQLDVVGGVALAGTLQIELDPAGAGLSDLLTVSGNLDISQATVQFMPAAALDDGAYVFGEYGSLTGSQFAAIVGLPDGYHIEYAYGGGNQLALVPEPGTIALLVSGAAAWGLWWWRKRRRDAVAG